MFIESTEQQSLELAAGAVDRVQVEIEGVDRVLHQAVLLIDTAGKDRQGSVHRVELLDGSGLTPPRLAVGENNI